MAAEFHGPADGVADAEQATARVVKKAHADAIGQLTHLRGEGLATADGFASGGAGLAILGGQLTQPRRLRRWRAFPRQQQ